MRARSPKMKSPPFCKGGDLDSSDQKPSFLSHR
jgi:hypothetical protein